jgi:hydroxyacylglutathione hydrolase
VLIIDDGDRRVHMLALGSQRANCYIVETRDTSFLVDPAADAGRIIAYLRTHSIRTPSFAIATHAHFDHIGAAAELAEAGVTTALYIHADDVPELARCRTFALLIAKESFRAPPTEHVRTLDAGSLAVLRQIGFEVKHLPSHTSGSIILSSLDGKLVFTGDIVLNNLVRVRARESESSAGLAAAVAYLRERFSPRAIVLPGHGRLTLLETELRFNPAIRAVAAGPRS